MAKNGLVASRIIDYPLNSCSGCFISHIFAFSDEKILMPRKKITILLSELTNNVESISYSLPSLPLESGGKLTVSI